MSDQEMSTTEESVDEKEAVTEEEEEEELTKMDTDEDSSENKELEQPEMIKDIINQINDIVPEENSDVSQQEPVINENNDVTDHVLDMLNLVPRKRPRDDKEIVEEDLKPKQEKLDLETAVTDSNGDSIETKNDREDVSTTDHSTSPQKTTSSLVQLFQKDSDSVLQLLSKALSMESLSELLKKEHQDNAVQLKALKEKLEKAHGVLSQCTEQKKVLLSQIEQVTDEIQLKRKQLLTTREELQELSMQESSLKDKRDTAYANCSELRKKVQACRDVVKQIQNLYGKRKKGEKNSVKDKLSQAES